MYLPCLIFCQDFICSDIEQEVWCFGEFKTNIGRTVLLTKVYPLAAGTATGLVEKDRNVPYCYNRKKAKGHNEDEQG
jgi:hypothetical protein